MHSAVHSPSVLDELPNHQHAAKAAKINQPFAREWPHFFAQLGRVIRLGLAMQIFLSPQKQY